MSDSLRNKVVHILATLFEVFVLAAKEVRRGRVKTYFRNLVGVDSPVQGALDKLKALNIGEERQVIADTYGGVNRLEVKTDEVANMMNQVNQTVLQLKSEARERNMESAQDKLKQILEPSPFPEDFFALFNKSRAESTGEWIIKDDILKSWVDKETQFLWISGAPGKSPFKKCVHQLTRYQELASLFSQQN